MVEQQYSQIDYEGLQLGQLHRLFLSCVGLLGLLELPLVLRAALELLAEPSLVVLGLAVDLPAPHFGRELPAVVGLQHHRAAAELREGGLAGTGRGGRLGPALEIRPVDGGGGEGGVGEGGGGRGPHGGHVVLAAPVQKVHSVLCFQESRHVLRSRSLHPPLHQSVRVSPHWVELELLLVGGLTVQPHARPWPQAVHAEVVANCGLPGGPLALEVLAVYREASGTRHFEPGILGASAGRQRNLVVGGVPLSWKQLALVAIRYFMQWLQHSLPYDEPERTGPQFSLSIRTNNIEASSFCKQRRRRMKGVEWGGTVGWWHLFLMEGVLEFNLLMLGRSGAGKSATTKLLTSNPAIRVANSLREVTTQVAFYEGSSFEVGGQEVRFRVLDIPGLDRIDNRLSIRSSILRELQERKLSLHAILYVSSLTERDTSDEQRLFSFLAQLPWSSDAKRNALVPLLTKYDNLVIDAHEEEVAATMREFQEVFERAGQGLAWGKRVYWVNQTRSLEFKISSYEDIREKYDKQVERLVDMVRKNKNHLTAQAIREMIAKEERIVLQQLMARLQGGRVASMKHKKQHALKLHVQVEPQSLQESLTAVSASSIGLFITRVCHQQVSTTFSALLMSVPIALSLLKLVSESVSYRGKELQQASSGESVVQSYEAICRQVNREMEREWTHFNELIQFKVARGLLKCRLQPPSFKFIDLEDLQLAYEGVLFERSSENGRWKFEIKLPTFKEAGAWTPMIEVAYSLRKLDESDVLRHIEELRREFCSHI